MELEEIQVDLVDDETTDIEFDTAFELPAHAAKKRNDIVRKQSIVESDDEEAMDVEQEGWKKGHSAGHKLRIRGFLSLPKAQPNL